jgi:signal transduction histidine kinase
LLAETDQIELRIQDDGCGFDPRAVTAGHLGISIMLERAAEIGGEVRIHSEPGNGTQIAITWSYKAKGPTEYDRS